MINDPQAVCNAFGDYQNVTNDIGEPEDFEETVGEFKVINAINKYDSHASICRIRLKSQNVDKFQFSMLKTEDVLKYMKSIKNK